MASSSSSSSPEISPAIRTEEQEARFSYKNATHEEVLEDLSRFAPMLSYLYHDLMFLFSRFILNLPDHELSTLERVSFQVEQACVLIQIAY